MSSKGKLIMKTLLLLGGSFQQTIAIKKAKEMGYKTIVCDYLPDNPGQFVADKFYLASTTDREEILNIAKKEKIDGILAYASDPAAPTAAYVAETLGLPSNPLSSVEILCYKDRFREFLSKNGFNTPKSVALSYEEAETADIGDLSFPVIVKPVDSSGSKGVSRVDCTYQLSEAIKNALSYSRCKKVIVEEWVERNGYQVAGDGLSLNGKLVFRYFGNDHFDSGCRNPFVPVAASFPYCGTNRIHIKIHNEVQRLISLLKMNNCTYNFDIRVDKDENVYLMEIAPRNGGNYIPQVINYATGIDLVECAIKIALGESICNIKQPSITGFYAYYSVHSDSSGILQSIEISEMAQKHIIENYITATPGDFVKDYIGSNTTLGILIMKYDSMAQMIRMIENPKEWITVKVKKQQFDK